MTTAKTEPSRATVENYYDERVGEKLRDFTHFNPRIEAAIQTLAEWAPANPHRVLEIGCGIGATAWRMARAWPEAEVIGIDLSPLSIEVAKTCFKRANLSYRLGELRECELTGVFDLILMMDVYEHIAPSDRPRLHTALHALLSKESRFILMIPSPAHQDYLRAHHPEGLQPVDGDIRAQEILALAEAVGTRMLYFREIGVWRYGDYFHAVLGREQNLQAVMLREASPGGLKLHIKRLLGRTLPPQGLRDLLGTDFMHPKPTNAASRFEISKAKRQRLAMAWRREVGA